MPRKKITKKVKDIEESVVEPVDSDTTPEDTSTGRGSGADRYLSQHPGRRES